MVWNEKYGITDTNTNSSTVYNIKAGLIPFFFVALYIYIGCLRISSMKEVLLRFHSKIQLRDNRCHQWIAGKNSEGYGNFHLDGRELKAHRFSYELYKGKIPKGLMIDHLCRNHSCVNPAHLEVVTNQENCIRGLTGKINNWQKSKTHCPQGHEYSVANTYRKPSGGRECRVCRSVRNKLDRLRKKQQV